MKRIFIAIFLLLLCSSIVYAEEMNITITAAGRILNAVLEDNPASRALFERLPLTVKMDDLYGREMCYHMKDALPTGELVSNNYEVGDLIYWPPRHSLVILYKQNGEKFSRQYLGHINEGVELFWTTGDVEVTFEAVTH